MKGILLLLVPAFTAVVLIIIDGALVVQKEVELKTDQISFTQEPVRWSGTHCIIHFSIGEKKYSKVIACPDQIQIEKGLKTKFSVGTTSLTNHNFIYKILEIKGPES